MCSYKNDISEPAADDVVFEQLANDLGKIRNVRFVDQSIDGLLQ